MELGISMFVDLHHFSDGGVQPGERFRELLEQVKLMDELGLDFSGRGEHKVKSKNSKGKKGV